MKTHIALLRAVNAGGHNKIAMADLRALLGSLGFGDVTTYVQSGNIVCTSPMIADDVGAVIRRGIVDRFGHDVEVMVRSPADLAELVAGFPYAHGDPKQTGVAFLSEPGATPLDASAFEPDECKVAGSHIYLHCPTGFARTKLTNAWIEKQTGMPATTRNWNTVLKLHDLAKPRVL